MLVDSHCHLDFPDFKEELNDVVTRARTAGIGCMLSISTRVRQFSTLLQLAERFDDVYCTVGTHPHYAAEEPDVQLQELVDLAAHPKVVGIGEAGLDYHYDNSPRDIQARSFRLHVRAAQETGLPLVIHSRDAEADTAEIIEEGMARAPFKPLLHCYSSRRELAERGLAVGAYVSFSGILTFKAASELREIAADIPADKILVETDAPYLAPVPRRGKRNEPAYVVHTAKKLAEVRNMSVEELTRQTTSNFFKLFEKIPSDKFLATDGAE